MVEFMFAQIQVAIVCEVNAANFVAIFADEINTMNNGISIHAYVVKNWVILSFMISLQRIKGSARANNLTFLIKALESNEDLDSIAISSTFLCFEANGMNAF